MILTLLENPAEVESIDGKSYRHREKTRTSEGGPEKEFPILNPFPTDDAQPDNRFEECPEMAELELELPFLPRLVIFQESLNPGIIILGGIKRVNNLFVAGDKRFVMHPGDKVD